jgi:DNA repair protein RadC
LALENFKLFTANSFLENKKYQIMRLKMDTPHLTWRHPGGKLRELGPESLTEAELLAILISSGIKDKPAETIADEILSKFGSFKGMANQGYRNFLAIKGLGQVKAIRIAAALEIARRIVS